MIATSSAENLLVVCLCARWCDTCEEYKNVFRHARAKFPNISFSWVDIEDYEQLLDDYDIETFPTLLISRAGSGAELFLGPVKPYISTLEQLINYHLIAASRRDTTAAPPQLPALTAYFKQHGTAEFEI